MCMCVRTCVRVSERDCVCVCMFVSVVAQVLHFPNLCPKGPVLYKQATQKSSRVNSLAS